LTSERIDKGVLVLDRNVIHVFGYKGFVSGGSWRTNIFLGLPCGIGFSFGGTPCPVSPQIEDAIAQNIVGVSHDHFMVDPGVAVRLFLEGKITPEHVRSAEVRDSQGIQVIVFCGVEFAYRPFNVLVSQIEGLNLTIDRDGLVV